MTGGRYGNIGSRMYGASAPSAQIQLKYMKFMQIYAYLYAVYGFIACWASNYAYRLPCTPTYVFQGQKSCTNKKEM